MDENLRSCGRFLLNAEEHGDKMAAFANIQFQNFIHKFARKYVDSNSQISEQIDYDLQISSLISNGKERTIDKPDFPGTAEVFLNRYVMFRMIAAADD